MAFTAQIAHLALTSPDPERCAAFYCAQLGLALDDRTDGDRWYLGWGRGHHALELAEGACGFDHLALETSEDELPRLAAVAGAQARDDHVSLHDPDGNRLVFTGAVDRSGEAVGKPGRRPVRLQHVTFASADVAGMASFYVNVLGFRVSDRMGQAFQWFRCGPEHHTVAVVEAPATGLDHFSFDVESWAAFKVWADRLASLGTPLAWGPGRHGPGNNLFVMFDDPDGRHIELSAEMEQFSDDHNSSSPRDWAVASATTNLWGPTPAWRSGAFARG